MAERSQDAALDGAGQGVGIACRSLERWPWRGGGRVAGGRIGGAGVTNRGARTFSSREPERSRSPPIQMKRTLILAIPLLAGAVACDLVTGPSGRVRAFDEPPNVVVENHGDRTIYYFAIEQSTAARTLWGPCDDPETCDRVPPRGREEIPYETISGYSADAEIILVYWWHLVARAGGGFEADSVRYETVRL